MNLVELNYPEATRDIGVSGARGKKAWTKKTPVANTRRPMLPASCARKWLVLTGLVVTLPAAAFAQGKPYSPPPSSSIPAGIEYSISGELNGDQAHPAAAVNAAGGWVVWDDNGIDGRGLGIGARRLDTALNPLANSVRVNQIVVGDQERPSVALLNNGGAVVVWQGGRLGLQQVHARFLKSDGTFGGDEILVSGVPFKAVSRVATNWWSFRNNRARYKAQSVRVEMFSEHERTGGAAVASLNDGTVVVAYESGRRFTTNAPALIHKYRWNGRVFLTNSVLGVMPVVVDPMQDVYFQLFTVDGVKVGGEIRANQSTAFNQRNPSIAPLADGTFVLAWISEQQPGRGSTNVDVMARIFSKTGEPLGDEFTVNTEDRPCANPGVAASVGGGFTVVWAQKDVVRSNSLDIFARAYSPSAAPVTAAFRVNTHTYGDQFAPRIASMPTGQLVVWTSLAQDGSREGVYGQLLKDGTIAGGEFLVNTTTYLRQMQPAVCADAGNRALVIWSSYQGSAGFDLFGQRYTAP